MSRSSFLFKASMALGIGVSAVFSTDVSAHAFTYKFGVDSTSSNSTATGAAATVEFGFQDIGNDQLQIDLQITNTTGEASFGQGATTSKLTGIAFDMFDGYSLVSKSLGSKLDTLITDVDFSPFSNTVGNFDVALADNNNFTGGNANGALAEGFSDNVSLVYSGLNTESVDAFRNRFESAFASGELDMAARFQQVDEGGSDKLLGGEIVGENPQPIQVPEPGNLMSLGLVTAGILMIGKRRGNQDSAGLMLMESAG